jgi:hypothetical protein
MRAISGRPGDASTGASHIGFRAVLGPSERAFPPPYERASLLQRSGDIVPPPQGDFIR